ncbi:MAG: hypothetical protein ACYDA8_20700 [Deferrisomatales bacterium]
MPEAVKTGGGPLGWAAGKWVNLLLVDRRGLEYRVLANDANYRVTQCTGPADPPNFDPAAAALTADRGRLYFSSARLAGVLLLVAETGTGSRSAANEFEVVGAGWTAGQWVGMNVRIGGVFHGITANTDQRLTLDRDPPAGAAQGYEVWRVAGDATTFTVFAQTSAAGDASGAPNGPWWDATTGAFAAMPWAGWHLRDGSGATATTFRITGAERLSVPRNGVRLTVATPAGSPGPLPGHFELVANPLLTGSAPLASYAVGAGGAVVPPSGHTYGTATVTVTGTDPVSGAALAPGRFVLSSRSATKRILLDAALDAGGSVRLTNWRQIQ